jgi:phosphotransferase system IIB component
MLSNITLSITKIQVTSDEKSTMDKDAFTKDETFNKIVPTNHNEIVEIVPNVGRVEDSNNNNRTLEVTVAPLSTNLSWT